MWGHPALCMLLAANVAIGRHTGQTTAVWCSQPGIAAWSVSFPHVRYLPVHVKMSAAVFFPWNIGIGWLSIEFYLRYLPTMYYLVP
ncbi:hypothetical protein B0H14DRAFT_2833114 [Mycena olivaceomarginata]|nr:hypothetical protein B0H14DRAFT_2865660 [Mycena olivaceomarginata]KAJ7820829.1 hypothetical protein B0H14DRAFT_2833114 [Mycena olivaceomarginata]